MKSPEQFLTKKCSEGLGEEKFTKALDLLKQMQEGDCRVVVDGIEFDGNEDDDVRCSLSFTTLLLRRAGAVTAVSYSTSAAEILFGLTMYRRFF